MRLVFIMTLLATALLSRCNSTNTNENNNTTKNSNVALAVPKVEPLKPVSAVDTGFKSCNPYYPLLPGSQVRYTLKFSSGLIADVNVVVDSTEEGGRKTFVETTQIVDAGGGLEKLEKTVRKYVCDGERVQIIYEKGNNRAGELANDFESKFRNVPIVIVEPSGLKRAGTTWSNSFHQVFQVAGQPPIEPEEPVTVNFEVFGEEEVTTPAGKFRAVKIGRRVVDKTGFDYFAKGLGLVKRVAADGTSWELKEYSGVKPIE